VQKKAQDQFDALLQLPALGELRCAAMPMKLNLLQAQKLTTHIQAIAEPVHAVRLAIVHTYTSDLLDAWLDLEAALAGFALHTYHAPYGVTLQEVNAQSGLIAHAPDLTLLMLRLEDLHPALSNPVARLSPTERTSLRAEALQRLRAIVDAFRAQKVGHILVSLLPPVCGPGLGLFDSQSERSETMWRADFKADLATYLRETVHASMLLDLDQVMIEIGQRAFFDERLWYAARFPFSSEGAREIARRTMAVATVLKYPKAKVLALDADNTLWGGIIGEDGINGIALGPDYPGNAYLAFQRRILDFQQRGFILALCSKNNPDDVKQVFTEHPHQLLRDEHFAAQRVNWLPKADNLISLAEELNLGLDSFIFVDDSSHECAAIRHRLPQVEVIQTPSKPLQVPGCLDRVARLEILSLTTEDLAKTKMYAQEKKRREFMHDTSAENYLASLQMQMTVGFDDSNHLIRLAQLTQKTNQFNLTTRRYSEQQIQEFIDSSDWLVAAFSLADIFGDSGLVGLALIKLERPYAELDTFLMSCRVIGREAESAFLNVVIRRLVEEGVRELRASYIPTQKNGLVANFLPSHGFVELDDVKYQRDLSEHPPKSADAYPIIYKFTNQTSQPS